MKAFHDPNWLGFVASRAITASARIILGLAKTEHAIDRPCTFRMRGQIGRCGLGMNSEIYSRTSKTENQPQRLRFALVSEKLLGHLQVGFRTVRDVK